MIKFQYDFDSRVLSTFEYTAPCNKVHHALVDMNYIDEDYGEYLDHKEEFDEEYYDELHEWFADEAYEQFKDLEERSKDPVRYHGLSHNNTGGIR